MNDIADTLRLPRSSSQETFLYPFDFHLTSLLSAVEILKRTHLRFLFPMCVNGAVYVRDVGSMGNVACVNQRGAIEFVWLSCERIYTCSAVMNRHVAAHSYSPVGSIAAVGQLPETTMVEKSGSRFM